MLYFNIELESHSYTESLVLVSFNIYILIHISIYSLFVLNQPKKKVCQNCIFRMEIYSDRKFLSRPIVKICKRAI